MVTVSRMNLMFLLAVVVLAGCSNAQLKRTPVTPRPTPWFCQINESREEAQLFKWLDKAGSPGLTWWIYGLI